MTAPTPWTQADSTRPTFDAHGRLVSFTEHASRIVQAVNAYQELVEALRWAVPLAQIATEDHRLHRIKCGHADVLATHADGSVWVGLFQNEYDEMQKHTAALRAEGAVKEME